MHICCNHLCWSQTVTAHLEWAGPTWQTPEARRLLFKQPRAGKGAPPAVCFVCLAWRSWTPALCTTVQPQGITFQRLGLPPARGKLFLLKAVCLHEPGFNCLVQPHWPLKHCPFCIKICPIIKRVVTCSLSVIFENTEVAERIKYPEMYHLKDNPWFRVPF